MYGIFKVGLNYYIYGNEMIEQIHEKPFSMGYVLRTTAKHMRKSIDISIRKTFEREAEFRDRPEKSSEVFKTLSFLHRMRQELDEFQHANSEHFKGE
jgi:hypothetical protein